MEKITKSISIHAAATKVWQVLWSKPTNSQWAATFGNGMRFSSEWTEGARVATANKDGHGGFGVVEKVIPNELMRIRELGWIGNWQELPADFEADLNGQLLKWEAGVGEYRLTPEADGTRLDISIELGAAWKAFLEPVYEEALGAIKKLAENPITLTVSTVVDAPVDIAWKLYNDPKHVVKWNTASPDWHTPSASNDFRVGGRFNYRMEARDGSFGFDFAGTYTDLVENDRFSYVMDDGRTATIAFEKVSEGTLIVVRFISEEENSLDMQQEGWQAILDSFREYTSAC